MRLWTISPKYLDSKGLVALWREALLAKKVLLGATKGYKSHPQLIRFKQHKDPISAINHYLDLIYLEAESRNFKFSKEKVDKYKFDTKIQVTSGQIEYEFKHLLTKLQKRDYQKYNIIKLTENIEIFEIFEIIPGKIESWEKAY